MWWYICKLQKKKKKQKETLITLGAFNAIHEMVELYQM